MQTNSFLLEANAFDMYNRKSASMRFPRLNRETFDLLFWKIRKLIESNPSIWISVFEEEIITKFQWDIDITSDIIWELSWQKEWWGSKFPSFLFLILLAIGAIAYFQSPKWWWDPEDSKCMTYTPDDFSNDFNSIWAAWDDPHDRRNYPCKPSTFKEVFKKREKFDEWETEAPEPSTDWAWRHPYDPPLECFADLWWVKVENVRWKNNYKKIVDWYWNCILKIVVDISHRLKGWNIHREVYDCKWNPLYAIDEDCNVMEYENERKPLD